MIEFLSVYWKYVLAGVLGIVSLVLNILILCKKKNINVIDSIVSNVVEDLPTFIQVAEATGKPGNEKLTLVVNACLNEVKKLLGRSLNSTEASMFSEYFITLIEAILLTPQKKGVTHEKENE